MPGGPADSAGCETCRHPSGPTRTRQVGQQPAIECPANASGTRTSLHCHACRAQLVPCDNCAAPVSTAGCASAEAQSSAEPSPSSGYRSAACGACDGFTVLGDTERSHVGLPPHRGLSAENVVRAQHVLCSPRVYLESKMTELQALRQLLRQQSDTQAQPDRPRDPDTPGRGGAPDEEQGDSPAKRQKTTAGSSPARSDREDVELSAAGGQMADAQAIRAAMARCRWCILLSQELAQENPSPPTDACASAAGVLLGLDWLRDLHSRISASLAADPEGHCMATDTEATRVIDALAGVIDSMPRIDKLRGEAAKAWHVLQRGQRDAARLAQDEHMQHSPASLLLGILKERQRACDSRMANASGKLIGCLGDIRNQQHMLCRSLINRHRSESRHEHCQLPVSAMMMKALDLWRQAYRCLSEQHMRSALR